MTLDASPRLSHDERLDRLAEIAVRVGLRLRHGQEVVVTAPVEALPLVRRITAHAYTAGAALVTTLFSDEVSTLQRFLHAPDDSFDRAAGWLYDGMAAAFHAGAARLAVVGEDPSLLSAQDPAKVARANRARSIAYKPALDHIVNFDVNWSIVSCATPAWAKAVFPNVPPSEALSLLWEAIFSASRVDGPDPIAAWAHHDHALSARTTLLNRKRFAALRFRGPGTDLTVGLADEHQWEGGATMARNGIVCNANIPTEEVFTTPHRRRVEGTVRSTRPLSYQGTLIEDIAVRFEDGQIVESHAPRAPTCWRRCCPPTRARAASARWRWCRNPRRSRKAASCSTTRCSTRTPRATSRSARPIPNASAAGRRCRRRNWRRAAPIQASSTSTG